MDGECEFVRTLRRDASSVVMPAFERVEVAEKFVAVPPEARARLLELRSLIFDTAAATPGVGRLEEDLRWGEPTYLTSESKSGTSIRIHWKARRPDCCAMYVHCQTSVVERFRLLHGDRLELEGSRAVLVPIAQQVPKNALRDFVRLALTYHLP